MNLTPFFSSSYAIVGLMSIAPILDSPSLRRQFLLTSALVIFITGSAVLLLAWLSPSGWIWSAAAEVLSSLLASSVFAVSAGLYVYLFFRDPSGKLTKSILPARDIASTLNGIATKATEYRISVRTGRHFRAEILPLLIQAARRSRTPIRINAVLIDYRDSGLCERYASYRKTVSFDRKLWNLEFVQVEAMATALALAEAAESNPGLVDVTVSLSSGISVFRIEGSSDELVVTREDPKDTAIRLRREDPDFSAWRLEFEWIQAAAAAVPGSTNGVLKPEHVFHWTRGPALEKQVRRQLTAGSPYVR